MPQQSTFGEAEKKAAERYKWWVVYLMREKRRLAGIAQAVQAGAAAQAEPGLPTPEVLPGESAEDFLMRVEQEREAILPDPITLLNEPDIAVIAAEQSEALNEPGEDFPSSNFEDTINIESMVPPAKNIESGTINLQLIDEGIPLMDNSDANADRLRGKAAVRLSRAAKKNDSTVSESF